MFRWETHCHTAEGSACGRASGADMARACRAAGYDGMIVTDHFYNGNTAPDRSLPWEEWVRQFCLGYLHAKEAGKQIGLTVCFGWEYSWEGTDFLTYGLSPEWLVQHPETVTVTPAQYLKLIRAAGGCLVQAHPFRKANYIALVKLIPDDVDAAEVWNAGNLDPESNDRAQRYADCFSLRAVSGSDAHWETAFRGGILTERVIRSSADYADCIRQDGIRGLIIDGRDRLFAE